MDSAQKNRAYVLWLLAARDYSRPQLERKLRARGCQTDELTQLLESLISEGLFRENLYPKNRTRQLIRKGFGPLFVKAKLRSEKCLVGDQEIAQAREELGLSAQQLLRLAIEKELRRLSHRGLSDLKSLENKIVGTLVRRGHGASDVRRLLKIISEE